MREVGEGFKWWLTGFADGESWFRFNIQNKGKTWAFYWGIKLRADDIGVLKAIQQYLGGKIYSVKIPPLRLRKKHNRINTKPAVSLHVYKREELFKLIKHFRTYPLQSKKQGDFKIWAKAVEMWHNAPRVGRLNARGDMRGMHRAKSQDVFDRVSQLGAELREYREFFDVREDGDL